MTTRKELINKGFWFFALNSIIVLLIASRYLKYVSDTDITTIIYLIVTTTSHFVSLSLLQFLIYLPIVLIIPQRTTAWVAAGIISALGSLLLLTDTFVFDLYRIHINRFILELIFGGAGAQIFEFSTQQYVMGIVMVLLFLGLMLFSANRIFNRTKINTFNTKKWVLATVLSMMFVSHVIHAWADAENYIPITRSSRYFPLFFPTTDKKLMVKLGLVDEVKSKENIESFSQNNHNGLNYPKSPIEFDTVSKTNIVLILIDSWHHKVMDSVATPNIYRFSKKCSVYNHHYSGSNGTRTGLFSLFYSIPGTYWDVVKATQTTPVWIDHLQQNNYTIKTFPSASIASPPFDRTIFRNVKDLTIETPGATACERDAQMTINWLTETTRMKETNENQAHFSFLFYDALHSIMVPPGFKGPFQPSWDYPKYEVLNNNTDPTPFFNLYKNSAFYVDSLVGRVLSDMEEKGMLENTMVIITGDHGQEFNDNKKNYWGHNGNYTAAQIQVPLMIFQPAAPPATYSHWTSHYDLVPAIMTDLFGVRNPISDYSIGKHLNDETPREWLLVGSTDNYAILESDRITSIYYNGTFDITDATLNPIEGATIQPSFINRIMQISKSFYKESK